MTETEWDKDIAGPGTFTFWDTDIAGPGTRTKWDEAADVIIGRLIRVLRRAGIIVEQR